MIDDPVLLNDWHVVARASELAPSSAVPARLLGVDLVVWRGDAGIQVWDDLCVHRGAKISAGRVRDGCLTCPYHGWTYNSSGECVRIPAHPSQKPPPRAHTNVHPVREAYGLVWTCLRPPAAAPIPQWPDLSLPGYPEVLAFGDMVRVRDAHAGAPQVLPGMDHLADRASLLLDRIPSCSPGRCSARPRGR